VNRTAPVLLASTSAYRRALLGRLGLAFEALAPGVEETPRTGELPVDRALRLALEKAHSVAALRPEALVIGSDQVAACAETLLEKPGSAERCREQLALLSGRTARFYTACAVLAPRAGVNLAHVDTTTVSFRRLSEAEIARYVERERPYDCAGGFKAESLGISLFEAIETQDPSALIGLPLVWLAGALRSAGYLVP
jgi:septum formation protein